MRNILHARFGEQRKQLPTSDTVPRISPSPQLPSNSVEELETALTKARDAWRASRGRTGQPFANSGSQASIDAPGVDKEDLCNDI
jgi:hypothetical protein